MNTPSNDFSQALAVTETLLDADTRRRIRADPRQYAIDRQLIAADADTEVKVVESAPDTLYIPLTAPAAFGPMEAADLAAIQGGARASTTGSAGSLGCFFCICTTYSTTSSAASVGTVAIEP